MDISKLGVEVMQFEHYSKGLTNWNMIVEHLMVYLEMEQKLLLQKFQSDNGLAADGIVGPKTQNALNGSLTLIKQGSRGAAVTRLQNTLNELGYSAGTADGIFGTGTATAVISFQENG